jgi:hypothetical protein
MCLPACLCACLPACVPACLPVCLRYLQSQQWLALLAGLLRACLESALQRLVAADAKNLPPCLYTPCT